MADHVHDERRHEHRKPRTFFCQILCNGRRYPAALLDISPSGLFVRTAAALAPGTEVEVSLRLTGGDAWNLRAVIARQPQSDGPQSFTQRGLGLRLLDVPDGFPAFVAAL